MLAVSAAAGAARALEIVVRIEPAPHFAMCAGATRLLHPIGNQWPTAAVDPSVKPGHARNQIAVLLKPSILLFLFKEKENGKENAAH